MNRQEREALEYVRNTNGGATKENFIEDFEPIGEALWAGLYCDGFVRINKEGRIYVTDVGQQELIMTRRASS